MINYRRIIDIVDEGISSFVEAVNSRPIYSKIIIAIFLGVAILLTLLIRTAPYELNKIEFFEFDSYIEYWQSKYVYENGVLSWYTLTRDNPVTHRYWYPWGRDFIYTSYPFLPMWIGTTYHFAKSFGLDLFTWAALQPVIFAALATIAAYFAASEVFGSRVAGIAASFLFATLPSAIERTVIGYVEKEGIASLFVFLFIYFYARSIKSVMENKKYWFIHVVLSALFLALVGWLWGGYVFILGTVVLYVLLSPLLLRKIFTKKLAIANILLVLLAMIFVIPSPTNAHSLGVYPPSIKGIGSVYILGVITPLVYHYLAVEYRKIGLKKPLLNPARYLFLFIVVLAIGLSLSALGLLPVSGRWAWALGLRIGSVDPLVESIAEHQSPLASELTAERMLQSWGVFEPSLLLFSPLALSIAGILYSLYTGNPVKVYLGLAFAAAFYSYINAVYMIGVASYFGILVASVMVFLLIKYMFPQTHRGVKGKKKIISKSSKSNWTRLFALLVFIAVCANTSYTYATEYRSMSNMVYTLKAGVSDLPFYSDSWYKAVEAIRSMPEDAVVIAWWDYGYGISVAGDRVSVADGSTINITQIGLVGLTLLSQSPEQAAKLAKYFNVKPNKTYMMIIEGVFVSENNNTVYIIPLFIRGSMPGLVDWPKSIWMMRIGNYVAEMLQNSGLDVNKTDTSSYLYVYRLGNQMILSPRLDKLDTLPLIYKLVVDGTLYWAERSGKKGVFLWFTGSEQSLDYSTMQNLRENLKLEVTRSIVVQDVGLYPIAESRPLANNTVMTPYRIILEPFVNPRTGESLRTNYLGYNGTIYSLILLYEFNWIPENN